MFPSKKGLDWIESSDSNFMNWINISLGCRIVFVLKDDYIKVCICIHKQIYLDGYLWPVIDIENIIEHNNITPWLWVSRSLLKSFESAVYKSK